MHVKWCIIGFTLLCFSKIVYPSDSESAAELYFGSQAVLQNCWTQVELAGSSQDKKSQRAVAAFARTPPVRREPVFQLLPLPPELRGSIRSVKLAGNRKLVALTFDLCEARREIAGYDAELVNYLRQQHVKATFYAGGKWMRSHPEKTLQLMADPLFEIGNHAWTHGNLRVSKEQAVQDQIRWTQAQYELLWEALKSRPCAVNAGLQELAKIPRLPLTFRFPYGACNAEALQATAAAGLPAIQWSIVTGDPAPGQTAAAMAQTILSQITPGAIIVAHANGRGYHTAQALPLLIPKLRGELGYQFVTVSELLAAGPAVTVETCYEAKPNDNLRYDGSNYSH